MSNRAKPATQNALEFNNEGMHIQAYIHVHTQNMDTKVDKKAAFTYEFYQSLNIISLQIFCKLLLIMFECRMCNMGNDIHGEFNFNDFGLQISRFFKM